MPGSNEPRRGQLLPFARPDITEAEVKAVAEVLRSGWLTTGPRVKEFEEAFAGAVGARHAVALSSGTAALHAAYTALGLGPGDEVITTPMTFAATVNMIEAVGAKPRFADIDPTTLNISPAAIEAALTERTAAIVPVHFAGLPCDVTAIRSIATRHNLPIIEDAAHALGASCQGRPVGSLADITIFSFHPTKNITTGEGGTLTTDADEWARRARTFRFHGITRPGGDPAIPLPYDVHHPGFKYNMTDLQAAIGLVQLGRLEEMNRRRRELAELYVEQLKDVEELLLPARPPEGVAHAWHLFVVRLRLEQLSIDRNTFRKELRALNIATGIHYPAVHGLTYYREKYGLRPEDFPAAYQAGQSVVSLPLFPAMTEEDVADVVRAIKHVLSLSTG
ncbi:MAG: DegT/DnrJ/EryC1/StrS family aminotransferase [Planctomycetes bacterium]|nr:DegT/DnrJ/EryC1/StrS family aminotransferase [Planctomycetota bacterium]